jgi:similar to stage IV sporulation protein
MLLSHRELCWISVNIRGTTANVEVVETVSGDREAATHANLVASCDGQIERIEIYEGNVTVRVGDVVREGDLLVSGIYDKGLLGARVTRAKGDIYARTIHSFEIEIPLESEEKVYTGREWTEKYVNFFGKRIKVFANTGNVGAECDIIYHNNGVSLPDGAVLPISIQSVVYREYRKEICTYGTEEAMERAFSALSGELEDFVTKTGAELLSKTVRCELDESAFRIHCTVICVENIALVQEFDIN